MSQFTTIFKQDAEVAFQNLQDWINAGLIERATTSPRDYYELMFLWAKWKAFGKDAGVFPISRTDADGVEILFPLGFCPHPVLGLNALQAERQAKQAPRVWVACCQYWAKTAVFSLSLNTRQFDEVAGGGFTYDWAEWLDAWYSGAPDTGWWEQYVRDTPNYLEIRVGHSEWRITDLGPGKQPDVVTFQHRSK